MEELRQKREQRHSRENSKNSKRSATSRFIVEDGMPKEVMDDGTKIVYIMEYMEYDPKDNEKVVVL